MSNADIIVKYLLSDDLSTYDPYDIWKTDAGLRIKKLFYRNKYFGFVPAGLLTVYDLFLNNSKRYGYMKQEYPVVRAQAALALLNLRKANGDEEHLLHAKKHISWLLENSSKGYSGLGWGTGFEIVISDNLSYSSNIPFTTNTPYILEALIEYFKQTNDQTILSYIETIARFYDYDIPVMLENESQLATSYGPFKDRIITNAVSYTMMAYSKFYKLFNQTINYRIKVQKMYEFIKSVQEQDGSWYYDPFEQSSFIDCFHSAFILKNIVKSAQIVDLPDWENVVRKGLDYLEQNFFIDSPGLFKRFSIANKPSLIKFDLYDNSEMLYLYKLLGMRTESEILERNIDDTFVVDDDIYSIIDCLGRRRNKNFLRWAVMPYLLSKSMSFYA